ncbi:MAG TPA: PKD domain-containing protein, partial [Polyangiaceae bacterium]|nr:PKD domain-containing protein [Polyangiaceae bacterium]
VPTNAPTDVTPAAGAAISLAPGAYKKVAIAENGVLTLSAGTYTVDALTLGPKAQIHLDTSGGTVNLWIHTSATWNGSITGDGSRFVLGYLGQDELVLQPGFQGTALAPFGTLHLSSTAATSNLYKGVFYGKHVALDPNVTVQGAPTPYLIDQLNVSKTTLCVGEQAEASLLTSNLGANAIVNLQGAAGTHQYVQFAHNVGARSLWASVYTPDGRADFVSVPITVQSCAATGAPPVALHFWGAKSPANAVEFMVRGYDANGNEAPMAASATYAWTFGDGQTTTTSSPWITHDYTAGMNPLNEHSFFDAQVTVTTAASTSTVKKVVPVWSLYARNRAKGVVQPPAKISSTGTNVGMTLTNYETAPITIQSSRVDLMPCDPSRAALPQAEQAVAVTIAASAAGTVKVASPKAYGRDICGMAIHLKGTSAAGAVYADTYQSLRENSLHRQPVTDANTIALLNRAATVAVDPNHLGENELRQLVAQGKLSRMPPSSAPGAMTPSMSISPDVNAGAECTPGDSDPSGGLACMPTQDWVVNPPEILNAYKGDIFMDHGCGKIGQLLGAIGQHFSHDTMFVKNHTEIRHSTANEDRMSDAVEYLSAKLDPDKVRYGFPGTEGSATHTIDEMTNYYCVADPEGKGGSTGERGCEGDANGYCKCPAGSWLMSGESSPDPVRCEGDYTAVPAVIVRPPPWDANAVKNAQAAADQTLSIHSHYRFYMYSHADQMTTAGPDTGWANGTVSSVCSSFVGMAASQAHVPMRPSNPGVPDGMRKYSVDTRVTAGNELYANTSNSVKDACFVTPEGGAKVGGALGLLGGPLGIAVGAGV